MVLVETTVRQSSVHGLGLFTSEAILQGTPVWRYTDGCDCHVPKYVVDRLPEPGRSNVKHFAYLFEDQYVVSGDNTRFINHSSEPNIGSGGNIDEFVALRDIDAGEELLEDYRMFDWNFAVRQIDR